MLRFIGWRDPEVGEIAAADIDPEAEPTLLAVAQLVDDEAGLSRAVDEDGDFRRRHNDTYVESAVGIGHGRDGLFEFARVLGAELLPGIGRGGNVLHGTQAAGRVGGLEIERPEIDRVVGPDIGAVEGDAEWLV